MSTTIDFINSIDFLIDFINFIDFIDFIDFINSIDFIDFISFLYSYENKPNYQYHHLVCVFCHQNKTNEF